MGKFYPHILFSRSTPCPHTVLQAHHHPCLSVGKPFSIQPVPGAYKVEGRCIDASHNTCTFKNSTITSGGITCLKHI